MDKKNANFLKKNQKDPDKVFAAIGRACSGLVYISETDAPVIPFRLSKAENIQAESLAAAVCGESSDVDVSDDEERFFGRLTAIKEWYGPAEIKRAKKFRTLKRILTEELRGLKMIRTGSIRIDIYVVGFDSDGGIMGVSTKAVET